MSARIDPERKGGAIEWAVSRGFVDYDVAVRTMQERAARIADHEAPELVWLLEHPPLYTAGARTRTEHLPKPARFPVHTTGRGGQLTYHGPGQRVIYVMLDVRRRTGDIRAFVAALEDCVIGALAELGVTGERRQGRVGVWVRRPEKGEAAEDKIAAIGLRVSRWVSLHGASLNVDPDLSHYEGIVPCGIAGHGVTSLAELGATHTMEVVDNALHEQFERRFGPTRAAPPPIEYASATSHAMRSPQKRSPAP
jgi:lipoyl(octanoyl) transferase